MLETTRAAAAAMGASERSRTTTTILACPRNEDSHALLVGGRDASPGSDGTEFFDAQEDVPWSPGARRHSPAADAAWRMQLALWDTAVVEPAAERPNGISTTPIDCGAVESKVCAPVSRVARQAWCRSKHHVRPACYCGSCSPPLCGPRICLDEPLHSSSSFGIYRIT